jgi:hypothetical protein
LRCENVFSIDKFKKDAVLGISRTEHVKKHKSSDMEFTKHSKTTEKFDWKMLMEVRKLVESLPLSKKNA